MAMTAEEMRGLDRHLETLINIFLKPADAAGEENIRYLEASTRLRSRLRLTAEEQAVLARKEQGLPLETVAEQLELTAEAVAELEKRIARQIERKRAGTHIHRRIPISLFYSAADFAAVCRELEQRFPGGRPAFSYEAVRRAARQIWITDDRDLEALIRYLHKEGCVVYAPGSDELRLLPDEEDVLRQNRQGEQVLSREIGKWDLRTDIVIAWNEAEPKSALDGRHQQLLRKYLGQEAFAQTVYDLRKQGLDGMAMAQALNEAPERVYRAQAQIWHLYKATFPVEKTQTGGMEG